MEAGNLRHKITLQRPAGGDLSDPNGATEWEDYGGPGNSFWDGVPRLAGSGKKRGEWPA